MVQTAGRQNILTPTLLHLCGALLCRHSESSWGFWHVSALAEPVLQTTENVDYQDFSSDVSRALSMLEFGRITCYIETFFIYLFFFTRLWPKLDLFSKQTQSLKITYKNDLQRGSLLSPDKHDQTTFPI